MAFITVTVLSFAALIAPPIPLVITLLIPLVGFLLTPLSPVAAWAAWSIGMIGSVFFPLIQSYVKKLGDYIYQRKHDETPDAEIISE